PIAGAEAVVGNDQKIHFPCPQCGARYRVSVDSAGKTARCKRCQALMPIPGGPPQR
ncbi:MAG TPA: hypothetical protein EYP56_11655, partial [Planctomycetaceae bacterium]|nr:hypothetical protein [Planctomycetaceae bacterium]